MSVSFQTKSQRQESLVYLALWTLLFAAPVLTLFIRTSTNSQLSFEWTEVFIVWRHLAIFLAAFLLHNYLLAPLLVYKQRKAVYFTGVAILTLLFLGFLYANRPDFSDGHRPEGHGMLRGEHRPDGMVPPSDDARPDSPEFPEDADFMDAPERPERPDDLGDPDFPDFRHPHPGFRRDHRPDGEHPPFLLGGMGQRDFISLVVLILMLGMNVGVKLYFKQHRDQKQLIELEKQNLEQQLEYLKYQINPHFLMNTLNNIHALVDIDPEKSKETIVELSRMMRFVLYEGSKQGVPLGREVAFLENYITLMKLRYTDKVRISFSTPETLPDREVPPLMFITFVENAFKHGVSYRQDSFIDIALTTDGPNLSFTCRNSRIPQEDDKHGGVGLQNVQKRLQLIYGSNYSLDIKDEPETYTVQLTIPLS